MVDDHRDRVYLPGQTAATPQQSEPFWPPDEIVAGPPDAAAPGPPTTGTEPAPFGAGADPLGSRPAGTAAPGLTGMAVPQPAGVVPPAPPAPAGSQFGPPMPPPDPLAGAPSATPSAVSWSPSQSWGMGPAGAAQPAQPAEPAQPAQPPPAETAADAPTRAWPLAGGPTGAASGGDPAGPVTAPATTGTTSLDIPFSVDPAFAGGFLVQSTGESDAAGGQEPTMTPSSQQAGESPWARPPTRTPAHTTAPAPPPTPAAPMPPPSPVSPAAPQAWAPSTPYGPGEGYPAGQALSEMESPTPAPSGYPMSDYPSLSEYPVPAQEPEPNSWSAPNGWASPADRWSGEDEDDWARDEPAPWPGAPAAARDERQDAEQLAGQHAQASPTADAGQYAEPGPHAEPPQTATATTAATADGPAVVPVPPQATGYPTESATPAGPPAPAPAGSYPAPTSPPPAAANPATASPYAPAPYSPMPPHPGVTQVPQRPYPEAAGVVRIPTHPAAQHPGPAQAPLPTPPGAPPPGTPTAAPTGQPPVPVPPGQPAVAALAQPVQPAPAYPEALWTPDGSVPTAEEFARRRAARPTEPVATMGVRAAVNKTTLGLVRLPPGRHEQEIRRDIEMVRRNFGGLRQVTVVNPKGGAGKTVAILLLAMTFGQKRGGYVLAWDNNETQGTLGMRAQQDFHARTVRDLLRDLGQFQGAHGRVGDLSQYVRSQGEGMFDVLASDESATGGEMLTAAAFGEIREVVSRFYKLIFVDTGNNVRAQNWQAAIDATDQLLVTMSARNDSAETAARMLDHLEQSGRQRLVRQAVTVVSMPPSRKEIDLPPIQRHFAARTRAVLLAPYERLIDTGEPIRYGQLSSATRDAWLKIAAAVAEGL